MHKVKSILHSSGRKRAQSSVSEADGHSQPADPRVEQHTANRGEQDRSTSSGFQDDAMHSGRSRPLTSANDSRPVGSASQSATAGRAQPNPSDSNGSIAKDYKAYLPVLSSGDTSSDEQNTTLGGDRRLIAGDGDARHGEDVADRNINRYNASVDAARGKALPKLPNSTDTDQTGLRGSNNHPEQSIGTGPLDSTIRTVPSDTPASQLHSSSLPAQSVDDEAQVSGSRKIPRGSQVDDDVAQPPPQGLRKSHDLPVRHREEHTDVGTGVADGSLDRGGQTDWKAQQKELLHGVVDLRNTVDTDRNVQVAPAVTHETIKPHEHEIIQHELHREIHNYSYYHRLQPVIHTEVLPPRHFIPNPRGEGLIEISADELPSRTGENRWWEIAQRNLPLPETTFQSRTETQVIEGKPYMTDEGFERRETTILYPPTLEDMEGYGGPIQPVHFDHKTGERWLGEVTTMDKLRQELSHVSDLDTMKFHELRESLPEVSPSPTIKRKPVEW